MFLDANVFIHTYDSNTFEHRNSKSQLKRIINGEMRASTSPLVLNEVLHFFLENRGVARAKEVYLSIRKMPNVTMLSVDEKVLDYVLRFVEQGMGTTDSYHAATMIANSVHVICSYDKGFDKIKGVKRQEPM